jgi:tRNA (adenine58-N1)-methyltransferase non-catalytic subunit
MLVDACIYLRMCKQCINPEITESWLRNYQVSHYHRIFAFTMRSFSDRVCYLYQVLPGRTHPQMTTSGGGGYILHAKRVINDEGPSNASQSEKQQGGNSSSSQDQMIIDSVE